MFNFLEYVTGGKGYLIREAVRLSHPYPVPGTVNKVSVVLPVPSLGEGLSQRSSEWDALYERLFVLPSPFLLNHDFP
jgi:hypothetical protein